MRFAATYHWFLFSLWFLRFRFLFAPFLLLPLLLCPIFLFVCWLFSSNMVPVLRAGPYASSPSGSGGGQHFVIQSCTTTLQNCVRFRQTTRSCRKSNTTLYKNRLSTMIVLQPLLSAQVTSGTTSVSRNGDQLSFLILWKRNVRNCERYRITTNGCRKFYKNRINDCQKSSPKVYKHRIHGCRKSNPIIQTLNSWLSEKQSYYTNIKFYVGKQITIDFPVGRVLWKHILAIRAVIHYVSVLNSVMLRSLTAVCVPVLQSEFCSHE